MRLLVWCFLIFHTLLWFFSVKVFSVALDNLTVQPFPPLDISHLSYLKHLILIKSHTYSSVETLSKFFFRINSFFKAKDWDVEICVALLVKKMDVWFRCQNPPQILFGVRASWLLPLEQQAQTAKRPTKDKCLLFLLSFPEVVSSGPSRRKGTFSTYNMQCFKTGRLKHSNSTILYVSKSVFKVMHILCTECLKETYFVRVDQVRRWTPNFMVKCLKMAQGGNTLLTNKPKVEFKNVFVNNQYFHFKMLNSSHTSNFDIRGFVLQQSNKFHILHIYMN